MGFTRQMTDAEKLRAIELLRALNPKSEVLRMYTAPAVRIRRADERIKARAR